MKFQMVVAVLVVLLLAAVSTPVLYAADDGLQDLNGHFAHTQFPYSELSESASIDSYSSLVQQDALFLNSSPIVLTKVGYNFLSLSEGFEGFRSVSMRAGVDSLSRSAKAGLQLILKW